LINELKINYETEQPTISARDIHKYLGIEKRFSAWFESNSKNFVENEDFTGVLLGTEVQNNGGVQLRKLQDYNLTIDAAKHFCIMSRTEKGKMCRQYLIDLEKAWNTPEQIMARALKVADARINTLKEEKNVLLEDVERMKPKEIFADAVSVSENSISVGGLAKLLKQNGVNIGQNRLFEWLRFKDYLIKGGEDKNLPTQKSMNAGWFEIKEGVVINPKGIPKTTKTTKVTGKGQLYFINKFLKKMKEMGKSA